MTRPPLTDQQLWAGHSDDALRQSAAEYEATVENGNVFGSTRQMLADVARRLRSELERRGQS